MSQRRTRLFLETVSIPLLLVCSRWLAHMHAWATTLLGSYSYYLRVVTFPFSTSAGQQSTMDIFNLQQCYTTTAYAIKSYGLLTSEWKPLSLFSILCFLRGIVTYAATFRLNLNIMDSNLFSNTTPHEVVHTVHTHYNNSYISRVGQYTMCKSYIYSMLWVASTFHNNKILCMGSVTIQRCLSISSRCIIYQGQLT